MSKSKVLVRQYNFTDAWLIQLADMILTLIGRDFAALLIKGVTDAKKATLQSLRDQFSETKPDAYYLALAGIETEIKDAARKQVETAIRTIFVAAENVYETGTAHYAAFGNPALTRLTDEEMVRNSRMALSAATKFLPELDDEGITQEILDSTLVLVNIFDKSINIQDEAQKARDLATEDRILKGNALYKMIVKICNSGKDAWAPTNESKYNDYVIYNTPSGTPEPTGLGSVRGTVTGPDGKQLEGVICKFIKANMEVETDEFGEYECDKVPVGKDSMEFVYPGYITYVDKEVEVFENQETINHVEMEIDETPTLPES
jgi:hypothetical protein